MKKRINTIDGKILVQGGTDNELKSNEIRVNADKTLTERVNGEVVTIGGNAEPSAPAEKIPYVGPLCYASMDNGPTDVVLDAKGEGTINWSAGQQIGTYGSFYKCSASEWDPYSYASCNDKVEVVLITINMDRINLVGSSAKGVATIGLNAFSSYGEGDYNIGGQATVKVYE